MMLTIFLCARFNIGEDSEENAIVTSTGQYVIAWDFGKVKKGQMDKYEIKKSVLFGFLPHRLYLPLFTGTRTS